MSNLISPAYIKKITGIADIVDDVELEIPLQRAQDRLAVLIGQSFFDQLSTQANTAPQTFSNDNQTFFDPYVKEYLAWQTYEVYFPKSNTYQTRSGQRVFKEENSDPASDKALGEQLRLIREDVKLKKEKLVNFLRTQQRITPTKYPLFTNSICGITGTGFGISAISKIDDVMIKIQNSTVNQEP